VDKSAQRLHAIQAAFPFTIDAGIIAPHAVLVQALVNPPRVTWEAIATCNNAIAPRAEPSRLPPVPGAPTGAGPVLASRLLVACGAQRQHSIVAALQQYAGIAPVTARTRGNEIST
jgi:hypothetical protein